MGRSSSEIEMSRKRIAEIGNETRSVFANIEWAFLELVGLAWIIKTPGAVNAAKIPARGLDISGFKFSTDSWLGLKGEDWQREGRGQMILALGQKILLADSLEIAAMKLSRAARLVGTGRDPIEGNPYFVPKIKELWANRKGKAGALISKPDRAFMEDCAAPIRHMARHQNGVLRPNQAISYAGNPRGYKIDISYQWEPGAHNQPRMSSSDSLPIFHTVWRATEHGLENALSQMRD